MVGDPDDVFRIFVEGLGDQAVRTVVGVVVSPNAGVPLDLVEADHGIQRRGDRTGMSLDVKTISLLGFETEVVDVPILFDDPVKGQRKIGVGIGCFADGMIGFLFANRRE